MSSADTRQRLERAVLDTVRDDGLAGLSARAVANRAGVNQALIFYHYDTVFGLLDRAARAGVEDAVERHRADIERSRTFGELLGVGRRLHEQERAFGNVAVMAQLTAGAHLDETVASAARRCLECWIAALEPTVRRLLADTPLDGLVDHRGLARAVVAGFLGLELLDGVDGESSAAAASALDQLGLVLEAVDDLGAVARRAVRGRIRRRSRGAAERSR